METFSPGVKNYYHKTPIGISSKKNWFLEQIDINNAYLHGGLEEEIYMELPQGLKSELPNLVCKLKKSLYGLKLASRQWNSTLTKSL